MSGNYGPKAMTGRLVLRIELGNDAMQTREQLSRAIRHVATRMTIAEHTEGRIRDENGNTVGDWEIEKE